MHRALHCRMWIWTPFPWLIPQDPHSPFQLHIGSPMYYASPSRPILEHRSKRNREKQSLPGSRNHSQCCLCFCGKRGPVPTIQNYQAETMKYLALSSPSPPLLIFWLKLPKGERGGRVTHKKSKRCQRVYSVIIWMLLAGVGHRLGGGQDRKISPSGDGMTHAEVEHGIWFMLLGSGEEDWARARAWAGIGQMKAQA